MASLKFFNTSTNQWEAIKTDSINGVVPNNQTYVATQGQVTFTIPNGTVADPKLLQVFVNGNIRSDVTMPNNTTFQLLTALNSGDQVYAQWFEVSVPVTSGHHATHEIYGNDAIDVTKLKNYAEQIQTPITDLQNNTYRKTDADSKFADVAGDTFTGEVTFSGGYKYTNIPHLHIELSQDYYVYDGVDTALYQGNFTRVRNNGGWLDDTDKWIVPISGVYNITGYLALIPNADGVELQCKIFVYDPSNNNQGAYIIATTNATNGRWVYTAGSLNIYLPAGYKIALVGRQDGSSWQLLKQGRLTATLIGKY
ncbi:MAG: hypothetical protein Q8880_12340 [Bacteroidota bacterium]|nr:hypothetical protein [Bacteroidota bacterium]